MAITFFPFLLIFLIAFFSIIRYVTGSGNPKLSEPYCAKCDYDLRVNWDSSMACPECGADLKAKNAVHFGKVKKKAKWWWVFILLCISMPMIQNILRSGTVKLATAPVSFTTLTNSQMIQAVSPNINDKTYWEELDSRHLQGLLSGQELDQIIRKLIQHFKKEPLKERRVAPEAGDWIGGLFTLGDIPPDLMSELLFTYYGWPDKIELTSDSFKKQWLWLTINFAHHGSMSHLMPYCELTQISTEADPQTSLTFVPAKRIHLGTRENDKPMKIGFPSTKVFLKKTLPVGEHRLNLSFTISYYPQLKPFFQPKKDDKPLASKSRTVAIILTVDKDGKTTLKPAESSHKKNN